MCGTPVGDPEGRLLGLVQASNHASDAAPMTYLLQAEEALAFVSKSMNAKDATASSGSFS